MNNTTVFRVILAIIVPPLAVFDLGKDKLAITTILWFVTGFGGPIAALYFLFDGSHYDGWRSLQGWGSDTLPYDEGYKAKRPPTRVLEREDGEILEVIDPEEDERHQRLSL